MNQSESYYHRFKVLIQPKKEKRRLVAIDETKIRLEKEQILVWAAIDVDTKEGILYGLQKVRKL